MQKIGNKIINRYGEPLFCVTFRITTEDFTQAMKSSRNYTRTSKGILLLSLAWIMLALCLTMFVIEIFERFIIISHQPKIPILTSFGLLFMAASFFGSFIWIHHYLRLYLRRYVRNGQFLTLFGYKDGYIYVSGLQGIENMSFREVQRVLIGANRWNELKTHKIDGQRILLHPNIYQVFIISNHDFSGTASYEETCNQLRSILEPPKIDSPPIAAPR